MACTWCFRSKLIHIPSPAWSKRELITKVQWGLWQEHRRLILGAVILAAWMSEILSAQRKALVRPLGMSQSFVGIVFLAIVGGAAESSSVIVMARKNRMDLSVEHRVRQLHPDRAICRTGTGAWRVTSSRHSRSNSPSVERNSARCFSPYLIGALVCGDGQIELVQGRAAHHGVRHHGVPILLYA